MTETALNQALENIYSALHNDNEDIDVRIAELKNVLGNEKSVTVEAARLAENSRQGRRFMQSYFKKRGILVHFS